MDKRNKMTLKLNLIDTGHSFAHINIDKSNIREVLFNNLCLYLLEFDEVKNDLKYTNIEIDSRLIEDVRNIFTSNIINKYRHLSKGFLQYELEHLKIYKDNKQMLPNENAKYNLYLEIINREIEKENKPPQKEKKGKEFNIGLLYKNFELLANSYQYYKMEYRKAINYDKGDFEIDLHQLNLFIHSNSIDENRRRLPELEKWQRVFFDILKKDEILIKKKFGKKVGFAYSFTIKGIKQAVVVNDKDNYYIKALIEIDSLVNLIETENETQPTPSTIDHYYKTGRSPFTGLWVDKMLDKSTNEILQIFNSSKEVLETVTDVSNRNTYISSDIDYFNRVIKKAEAENKSEIKDIFIELKEEFERMKTKRFNDNPPERTFIDYLNNIENKEAFAQKLKQEFTDLLGRQEAAFVYALIDNGVLDISKFNRAQIHRALYSYFNNTGMKESPKQLNDKINENFTLVKNHRLDILIKKYSAKIGNIRNNLSN